jgi:hypothetical protein
LSRLRNGRSQVNAKFERFTAITPKLISCKNPNFQSCVTLAKFDDFFFHRNLRRFCHPVKTFHDNGSPNSFPQIKSTSDVFYGRRAVKNFSKKKERNYTSEYILCIVNWKQLRNISTRRVLVHISTSRR